MPVYKGRYLYMFEEILDPPSFCYATPKSYSNYNYQSIYLTKLTQKLIQETHAKANMKPPYEGYYAPECVVCVDLYTGKEKWAKYFIDNDYIGYEPISPPLSLVNSTLYIPETTYDPGISFSDDPRDKNFGVELLRFNAVTGEELPIPHKAFGTNVQYSKAPIVLSVNGQPKVLNVIAGSYIYKNNYLFVSIQPDFQIFDPNYGPDQQEGWKTYFYFAPVSNLWLQNPTDAGIAGMNYSPYYGLTPYYKVYKPFTFKYFTVHRTPIVSVRNETPNSGLTDVYMRYANGSIYAFYKYTGNVTPKYPSIVCINATP